MRICAYLANCSPVLADALHRPPFVLLMQEYIYAEKSRLSRIVYGQPMYKMSGSRKETSAVTSRMRTTYNATKRLIKAEYWSEHRLAATPRWPLPSLRSRLIALLLICRMRQPLFISY